MLLDSMPAMWRHLVIGLLAALLGWGGSDLVPWLAQHGPVAALVGALLGQVLLVVTPWLTTQYGVGAAQDDGRHEA